MAQRAGRMNGTANARTGQKRASVRVGEHEDGGLVSRAKSARLRGGRGAETEKIGEE